MKVAVTGATGFIGRHLVRELLRRGDQSILLARNIHKLRSLFDEENREITLVQTDYGEDLDLALKNVEAIVHLGGLRWCKDKVMQDYITSNVMPTVRLYASAANKGVRNIVFASSRAVYNPRTNALPFTEDQDCYPLTHYGVGKLVCEKIAGHYNAEFGMNIKSLRIAQVVGKGEHEGSVLSTFVRQAKSRQTLNIWGEGIGARDYIYVLDAVQAIVIALDHASAAGVFNIGSGKAVTCLQLAETINEAFGNSGNLTFAPDRIEDTSYYLMSCERAARELRWRAQWNLEDMFADLAQETLTSHPLSPGDRMGRDRQSDLDQSLK